MKQVKDRKIIAKRRIRGLIIVLIMILIAILIFDVYSFLESWL